MHHIAEGITSARDAVYNGLADAAANAGHTHQDVATQTCILSYLAKKQKQATVVYTAIVKRIARVAKAVMAKLEASAEAKAKRDREGVVTPPIPEHCNPSNGITLTFEALPPLPTDKTERQCEASIQVYWKTVRIQPILEPLKEIGVTWLELFLHYSLSGGSAVTAKSEHLRLAHSRLFNSFKKRSKQLFKFGSPGTRPLLKASTASPAGGLWPLAAYGMQAKLPTLPFKLGLGRDVTARIHAGLCSYGAKVPSTSQLPTKLRNAKLKLPRFAPWEHLREHSFPLFEMSARYINRSYVERRIHNQTISYEGFWLRCPQCNDTRDLRSITLYRGNSVCRIRCIMCKHLHQ